MGDASLGFKFLNGLDSRGMRIGELNANSLSAGSLAVTTIEGQGGGGVSFTQPISDVTFEQVTIQGGTINNVSIGTEIPGIGFFTNVNITGNVTVSGNIISEEGSEATLGNLQIVENTISAVAPIGDGDIILDPLDNGDVVINGPLVVNANSGSLDVTIDAEDTVDINGENVLFLTSDSGQVCIESATLIKLIAGTQIQLTPGSNILVAADKPLTFANGSNSIVSNGTDLTVSGNAGDVNINAGANINLNQDTTIAGNLTVTGTTTTINSTTLDVVDPVIQVGEDLVLSTKDRGIEFKYNDGSAKTGFFGWDRSENEFIALIDATNNNEEFSGTYLDARFGNMQLASLSTDTINGNDGLTINTFNNADLNLNVNGSGDVNIPANVGLTFGGDSQKLESDGTDLSIASGGEVNVAASDINLSASSSINMPVDIPLEMGHPNTEIHGTTSTTITQAPDGGDVNWFAESDNDIYLVPAVNGDVIIPEDVGLQFGTDNGNRIEYNGTDLCIFAVNDICLNAGGDVSVINNMVIGGDLTVTGALNTSSSVGSDVDTPIIQLGDHINFIVDGEDETPGANQVRLRVQSPHYLVATDIFTIRESSEAAADGEQIVDSVPVLSFNVDVTSGDATVVRTGGGGDFTSEDIIVNDYLTINGETKRINAVTSTTLTMDSTFAASSSNQTASIANQLVFTDAGVSASLTGTGTIKYSPTADDNLDRGVQFNYNDGAGTGTANTKRIFVGWDDSFGKVVIRKDITNTGNVIAGDLGELALGTLCLDELSANGAKIDVTSPLVGTGSGAIDNLPIGSTTPSTGVFTTLTANSTLTLGGHLILNVENISGAGGGVLSPSSTVDVSFITVTGTGILSGTMPDGTINGQVHHIVMETLAVGSSYELTFAVSRLTDPGSGANTSSKKLVMDCGSQGVMLVWSTTSGSWFILNGGGNLEPV